MAHARPVRLAIALWVVLAFVAWHVVFDRILVLANVTDKQLGSILDLDGREPSFSPDAKAMLHQIGKAKGRALLEKCVREQEQPLGLAVFVAGSDRHVDDLASNVRASRATDKFRE